MFQVLKKCFTLGCIIAATYFLVLGIHQYTLNKDNSSVSYKEFHEDEDSFYPSISLCFLREAFLLNEDDFSECYQSFLLADSKLRKHCPWNTSYAGLDYDSITKNLSQYIIGEVTVFEEGSKCYNAYKGIAKKNKNTENELCNNVGPSGYTSILRGDRKCITFNIPFKSATKVKSHAILLNNSIFKNKRRPKHDFEVVFHYPNQTMRPTSKKYVWKTDKTLLNQSCVLVVLCCTLNLIGT